MRVLVTGATGFIGGALALRLLARGETVVALARRPRRAAALAQAGALVLPGDLLDEPSLRAALTGCEAVIHCAGRPGPATWRLFRRLHVRATETLVKAAAAAGARRFVNVASQTVLFDGQDLLDVGDDAPYPARYIDPYSQTKAEGERAAMAANGLCGMTVTSVRPGVVWGRGDRTILPIMVRLARGTGIPASGPGDNIEATSHIDNTVDGLLGALDSPRAPGRTYLILDAFTVTWREFFTRTVEAAGVRARFMNVPAALAGPATLLLDRAAGALGLPVPLAHFGLRAAVTSRRFAPSRARDDFGYQPRVGWEDGLADLAAWVRRIGGAAALLKPR